MGLWPEAAVTVVASDPYPSCAVHVGECDCAAEAF